MSMRVTLDNIINIDVEPSLTQLSTLQWQGAVSTGFYIIIKQSLNF